MSADPSTVDSATLFKSLRRDLDGVRTKLWDAAELLREADATAAELVRRHSVADTAEPYEATDAEVREGEQLDSVSYVLRRGETDDAAFRRAARAEIVRLRRYLAAIERAGAGR